MGKKRCILFTLRELSEVKAFCSYKRQAWKLFHPKVNVS